jgi:hypothetical protein
MKKQITFVFLCLLAIIKANTLQSQIITIGSCDFSTNCPSVHLDTAIPSNIWRIGQTSKAEFLPSTSAIVTGLSLPYPINNDSYFDINISGVKYNYINPLITFDHKFITDTLNDGGYIEVSFDQGTTWKNVVYDSTMYYNFGNTGRTNVYSPIDTITGKIPSFNGSSNGWIHSEIEWVWWMMTKSVNDFTYPAGDTLTLRFHFKSDNNQTNKAGWIIDNVNISNIIIGGVDDYLDNANISISPNPLSESASVRLMKENVFIHSIEVFDVVGHCVLSEHGLKTRNYTFNKNNLQRGIYFMKIEDSDAMLYSRKCIID